MTGTNSLTIRPIGPEDYTAWHRLWTAYLAFYETQLPEEIFETSFARLLSDDPDCFHGRLACVGERPVGLVHYLFHAHMWRAASVCYLQDLYSDTDVRGSGVGRALIEAVYAEADAAGAPRVYWLTQKFNHEARKLYDRVGVKTPFIRYDRPAS